MMKNILLPSDLTVTSLWPVHTIIKDHGHKPVNIQIVHLLDLPVSITDLLFLHKNRKQESAPEEFLEAIEMLRNRYKASIHSISFRFIYGNTVRAISNFLEGNHIDELYYLGQHQYHLPRPTSIDIIDLLKKCNINRHELVLNKETVSEFQILSALLYIEQYSTSEKGSGISHFTFSQS